MKGETCCACGRYDPPGGVRLTDGSFEGPGEFDFKQDWICKRAVACAEEIARQLRTGERR